ncbi:MAG TPA: LamG-like jellyroll fold domain-containing protein [Planctomycetota bacterium]|jgi:hypothetical protein|nr:LamG-like jellyroll fold domain-containing protein [Planctomycetota bacterium]
MGQEILYCFKCQERVTSAELDASKGLRFGLRTACKKCVPDLLASLSEKERNELVAKVHTPSSQDPRTATGKYILSTSTPRARSVPVVPALSDSPSNAVWAFVGGAVVIVIIAAVFLLMNSGGSPPSREHSGPLPPSKPPTESARDRSAREALERAKSLPAADLEAQVAAYAEAARLAQGTLHEREAKERHEGMLDMRRKAYARELSVLEERAKALTSKEEFQASIVLFQSARTLHDVPEWGREIQGKIELQEQILRAAFADVKAKAALAREKGSEDELKVLRERVLRWGVPKLGEVFEAHIASLAPPVDARPWTPIFDGKSLDFLIGKGEGSWVVQNGALVRVKDRKPSAQTRRLFTDGEFRIRFEGHDVQHAGFAFRQELGYFGIGWNRVEYSQFGNQEHELLVVLRGSEATATLDGKPQAVLKAGKVPLQGPVQFNAYAEFFAVKSLEFRELALDDGLVGHWTFDSISGVTTPDFSPSKNDGRLVDGPLVVPGRLGSALRFNGRTSYVTCPSSAALDLTGPFTISAWVNVGRQGSPASGIVEKWHPGKKEGPVGYYLRLVGGRIELTFPNPAGEMECRGNKTIPPDTWTLVTGVFDGSSIIIYVDGVLDRSNPVRGLPGISKLPLVVGAGGSANGNFFMGDIDDVRIYSRALSAPEIARLAQGK